MNRRSFFGATVGALCAPFFGKAADDCITRPVNQYAECEWRTADFSWSSVTGEEALSVVLYNEKTGECEIYDL